MAKKSLVKCNAATRLEKFAARVANDIHEGIDNGENRGQLRDAISWYARQNCTLRSQLSTAETQIMVAKFGLAVILELLKKAKVGAASDIACLEQALKILQSGRSGAAPETLARSRPKACQACQPGPR